MAIGSTLPPQAYTREVLAIAFNWLQTQPESTRKLATSPDALVGLYLRAQRFGHSTPENDAPVSSQSFISDLKHLAEGLKQFESPQSKRNSGAAGRIAPAPSANTSSHRFPNAGTSAQENSHNDQPFAVPAAQPLQPLPVPEPQITQTPPPPQPAQTPSRAQHPPSGFHLNSQTQTMIQEVKSALNLSSEAEVINMMVSIAYKNLKSLLD